MTMSHLRLLWINGKPVESRDPAIRRRRLPVETTSEGCRIAWLVVPMAASSALTVRDSATQRKPRKTLRRIGIVVLLAVLLAMAFNLLAAVGMHSVLSRSTPSTSMGPAFSMSGVRNGQI
ncbi:hypothetical protein ACWDUN_20395 [Mycobacterium sp. NPDC003323]|uniref:hypothetical protein n=1 Tax=Mycolicibacterium neoaurum TaxID=1795 RepID=UPI001BD0F138|nr:hypothetical protein [Mycolicibacterium neoaurum]QVI27330.1 hypothetical protein MN2019_24530 [Mycolicibacterium neoaurum]